MSPPRQFDIWGGVVNTAARIAKVANPGTVAMTRRVAIHVTEKYNGTFRSVPLKGIQQGGEDDVTIFEIALKKS